MVFYDNSSINLLQDKLDYENWFLSYISDTNIIEYYKGTYYYRNEDINSVRELGVAENPLEDALKEIMEKMSPLTFASCYKILDMIFEWILEEHQRNNIISNVPWKFMDRINEVKFLNMTNRLQLPIIMRNENYIFEYAFALYENLRKYRNEVVHDNNFSLINKKFQITTSYMSVNYQIEMDNQQMNAFIRTVSSITEMLLNTLSSITLEDETILKCNLDRIHDLHQMSLFNSEQPVLFRVVVNTIKNRGKFSLNLEFIRDELKKVFPDRNLLLDLFVVGITEDSITNVWHFPVDDVPEDSLLELDSSNYMDYTSSITELESNVSMDIVNNLI